MQKGKHKGRHITVALALIFPVRSPVSGPDEVSLGSEPPLRFQEPVNTYMAVFYVQCLHQMCLICLS